MAAELGGMLGAFCGASATAIIIDEIAWTARCMRRYRYVDDGQVYWIGNICLFRASVITGSAIGGIGCAALGENLGADVDDRAFGH